MNYMLDVEDIKRDYAKYDFNETDMFEISEIVIEYHIIYLEDLLTWAIRKGYIEIIKDMVLKYEINMNEILSMAVENNNLEIVKYSCENGADCNYGISIFFDALENNNLEMVKYLCEHGLNFHKDDDLGIVIENKYYDVVKYLMHYVKFEFGFMSAALHWAIQNDCFEIVKYIIEVVPSILHEKELYYDQYSCLMAFDSSFIYMPPMDFTNYIKLRSREFIIRSDTMLCAAIVNGNVKITEYLCEKGFNVHENNDYSLGFALIYKNDKNTIENIQILLCHGATLHSINVIESIVNKKIDEKKYKFCEKYIELLESYMEKAIEINCNTRLYDINLKDKIIECLKQFK